MRYLGGLVACGCLLVAGYFFGRARAADPVTPLVYSGLILENGQPSSADSAKVRVSLYAPGASEPACPPTLAVEAELRAGRFELVLHDDCVEAVVHIPQLLVHLEINDEPLEARPLGTVPYALHARSADSAATLAGRPPGDFAPIDHTHAGLTAQSPNEPGVQVGSSLGYRLATLKVGGAQRSEACSTPTCAIRASSGSVRAVERQEAGVYWVYFEDGSFAEGPACACNPLQGGGSRGCAAVDPGRQAVMVHTYSLRDEGLRFEDLSFDLICIGPAPEAN